jgi:glycosyltransferase involved in cell wall biosynthesis
MSPPRFTLALYVQNAELHLSRALRSVLSDRTVPLELLAVDAGSRDDSLPQLREWATRDERLRVLSLGPCAQAEAFNVAISLARGRSLGLLDAHDWWAEGAWSALSAAPEAEVIVGGCLDGGKDSILRARRRAWGVWFSLELLRRTRAQVGAQRVDDDLLLMLDSLSAAKTIACLETPLFHRGAPSARVVVPPLHEVVDERLTNVERLANAGYLLAARDEALEVAALMRALPAKAFAQRAVLLTRALGAAWQSRQKEG